MLSPDLETQQKLIFILSWDLFFMQIFLPLIAQIFSNYFFLPQITQIKMIFF